MQQLVFATNNRHKVEEVAALTDKRFEVLTLKDIGCTEEIAETALTFAGNASLKSNYIFKYYHINCFGDDSGLEIDALGGEPGIYSARYAGTYGNHEANMNKVLDKLQRVDNRSARFKTVISLIWAGKEYFFEGTVEGLILHKRHGTGGFGYDPVFKPNGYNITFAEMDLVEKNKISHRGRAIEKMMTFLKEQSV